MPECQTLYSPKRGQYAGMSEKISHTRGVNCPEQGVNYSGTGGQLISEYTVQFFKTIIIISAYGFHSPGDSIIY